MMKDPEIEKEGYEVVNGFVVKSNIEENLEDKLEPPAKKLKNKSYINCIIIDTKLLLYFY